MPTFPFTVRAEDNQGNFADRNFEIEVLNTLRERVLLVRPENADANRPVARLLENSSAGADLVNSTTTPANLESGRTLYNRPFFYLLGSGTTNSGVAFNQKPIYRSTDGLVWEDITANLTYGPGANDYLLAQSIKALSDGNLYISDRAAGNRIWTSTDGGDTWSIWSDTLPASAVAISFGNRNGFQALEGTPLAINPTTGTAIFTSRQDSIYRSTDGGVTWVDTGSVTGPSILVVEFEGGAFHVVSAQQTSTLNSTLANPSYFVSFDDGAIFSQVHATLFGITSTPVRSVKYLNGRWCMTRHNTQNPSGANLFFTEDYVNVGTPTINDGMGTAATALRRTQGRLYTVLGVGTATYRVAYSDDGVNWFSTDVGGGATLDTSSIPVSLGSTTGQFGSFWTLVAADDFTV